MAQSNFNGDAAEWTYESGRVLMEGNHNSNNSKAPLKKGPWTAAEDQILMEYVRKHGEGNWNSLQKNSGLNRCGKSCRLRWANHLRPNLKKGAFTPDEERLILELHAKYGNKWARMASQLPGRTDNEIKNYWNTKVKRRQRKGLLPLYPPEMKQSHFISHNSQSNDNLTTVIPTDQSSFGFELPSSQTQQLPPLSSSTPSLANYNNNSIPIFDAATSTPSYALHRPAPILGYKRYRETLTFSPPISPTVPKNSSVLRTSSMPDISSYQYYASGSSSNTSSMPDMASLQFQPPPSMNFHGSFPPLPQSTASINQFEIGDIMSSPTKPPYSTKPEIMPSTQVAPQITTYHHPQFEITNNTESKDINVANAAAVIDNNETHNYDIGMLESLLQEAEALTSGDTNPNKSALIPPLVSFEDQKRVLDDLDQCLQPTSSINNHSFLEMQAIPDHEHMKSLPDELSKLMSFEPVSDWYGTNNGNYSTLSSLMEYHT